MIKNISGQKFNRLTALEYVGNTKDGNAKWLCTCDCGKQVVTTGVSLRNGNTKSCGCIEKGKGLKDLIGQKFGRLFVISMSDIRTKGDPKSIHWLCRCDCGNEVTVRGSSLRQGLTKSCGCLHGEKFTNRKHGQYETPEYKAWEAMIQRCYNPNCRNYKDYGKRGITVCDRWRNNSELFLLDMGKKPSPQHSIDRINNELGYSPDNCRWATRHDQRVNQRPRSKKAKNQKVEQCQSQP